MIKWKQPLRFLEQPRFCKNSQLLITQTLDIPNLPLIQTNLIFPWSLTYSQELEFSTFEGATGRELAKIVIYFARFQICWGKNFSRFVLV